MNFFNRKIFFAFYIFIFFQNILPAAKLPHQGRVLIAGIPFHGDGQFGFALISENGDVLWNHQGGIGQEPSGSLSIFVEQGFYSIELGDLSIPGMADLSADLFETNSGMSL